LLIFTITPLAQGRSLTSSNVAKLLAHPEAQNIHQHTPPDREPIGANGAPVLVEQFDASAAAASEHRLHGELSFAHDTS